LNRYFLIFFKIQERDLPDALSPWDA